MQVPKRDLSRDGTTPTDVMSANSVIGVWATASRRSATMRDDDDEKAPRSFGGWKQVSRLGEPLINEVVIPIAHKDRWNRRKPHQDADFLVYYQHPELAKLIPVLYPGALPNLAALNASNAPRADLVAILLTGIPGGLIPGFQNFTGATHADELRLNMAIPPGGNNKLGLLGGDLAGFPNGRRVFDDVVAIELRAVAGAVYPLINPAFVPDAAVGLLEDGTAPDPAAPYLGTFPYLGTPYSGYDHAHD